VKRYLHPGLPRWEYEPTQEQVEELIAWTEQQEREKEIL
jgi:hypothetical protein